MRKEGSSEKNGEDGGDLSMYIRGLSGDLRLWVYRNVRWISASIQGSSLQRVQQAQRGIEAYQKLRIGACHVHDTQKGDWLALWVLDIS